MLGAKSENVLQATLEISTPPDWRHLGAPWTYMRAEIDGTSCLRVLPCHGHTLVGENEITDSVFFCQESVPLSREQLIQADLSIIWGQLREESTEFSKWRREQLQLDGA